VKQKPDGNNYTHKRRSSDITEILLKVVLATMKQISVMLILKTKQIADVK
jgi:hypothetical protein